MNHLIISFITPDRPGVVDTLSDLVKTHQGNWQKSSLHNMSGFFSGVVEIAVEQEHAQELKNALSSLANFKMHIEQVASANAKSNTALVLELTANDRAGIVQEISSVIHQSGGNLLKLVSTCESAPHAGHNLFKAKITICATENVIETMITKLENLADDLMVDISK
jgi:glycine cleavage system regulatory protein